MSIYEIMIKSKAAILHPFILGVNPIEQSEDILLIKHVLAYT